jgi:hypothetical protein
MTDAGRSASHIGSPLRYTPLQDVGKRFSVLGELQRHRVEAMALAGGWRTVGEYMAQVAAASGADLLDTDHPVTGVANALDVRFLIRLEKLGHPVPESNLALERNRGKPQNRQV